MKIAVDYVQIEKFRVLQRLRGRINSKLKQLDQLMQVRHCKRTHPNHSYLGDFYLWSLETDLVKETRLNLFDEAKSLGLDTCYEEGLVAQLEKAGVDEAGKPHTSNPSVFKFENGDRVNLFGVVVSGTVVDRAERKDLEPTYMVRYQFPNGPVMEEWFDESAIK